MEGTLWTVAGTAVGMLLAIVTIVAVQYLRKRTTLTQHQDLAAFVKHAVEWAEQTMAGAEGQAKLEAVMERITSQYPNIREEFIVTLVESYVRQIKSWRSLAASTPYEN